MLQQLYVMSNPAVVFPIADLDHSSKFILKNVSGLSSAGADLYMGDYAREGGYYQGRRAKKRNPVITLKLNPDYANNVDIDEVREELYSAFMEPTTGGDGVIVFLYDSKKPLRYFQGYTESIEVDMFQREVVATISMLTTDPYIRSFDVITKSDFAGNGWYNLQLDYHGTAKAQLNLDLKVLRETQKIVVQNVTLNTKTTLVGNFKPNDVVNVFSETAIMKNGADSMGLMTADSRWLLLRPGMNQIQVSGESAGDGRVAITRYMYPEKWWGI